MVVVNELRKPDLLVFFADLVIGFLEEYVTQPAFRTRMPSVPRILSIW
jgi:hypothetical protein